MPMCQRFQTVRLSQCKALPQRPRRRSGRLTFVVAVGRKVEASTRLDRSSDNQQRTKERDTNGCRGGDDVLVSVRVAAARVLAALGVVDGAVHLGRGVVCAATVDGDTALTRLERSSKGHSGNKGKQSERELHGAKRKRGHEGKGRGDARCWRKRRVERSGDLGLGEDMVALDDQEVRDPYVPSETASSLTIEGK